MIINKFSPNIIEVMELRKAIESEACFLAATRCTEEDIINIEKTMDNLKVAIKREEVAQYEDLDFHLAITKASGNILFYEVMTLLSDKILITLYSSRKDSLKMSGRSKIVYKEHEGIFNAIKNRDPHGAKKAMNKHLENVIKKYI